MLYTLIITTVTLTHFKVSGDEDCPWLIDCHLTRLLPHCKSALQLFLLGNIQIFVVQFPEFTYCSLLYCLHRQFKSQWLTSSRQIRLFYSPFWWDEIRWFHFNKPMMYIKLAPFLWSEANVDYFPLWWEGIIANHWDLPSVSNTEHFCKWNGQYWNLLGNFSYPRSTLGLNFNWIMKEISKSQV